MARRLNFHKENKQTMANDQRRFGIRDTSDWLSLSFQNCRGSLTEREFLLRHEHSIVRFPGVVRVRRSLQHVFVERRLRGRKYEQLFVQPADRNGIDVALNVAWKASEVPSPAG
jgi:hypothetical protein